MPVISDWWQQVQSRGQGFAPWLRPGRDEEPSPHRRRGEGM